MEKSQIQISNPSIGMVAGLGDNRGELRLTFAKSLGSVGEEAIPILCEALKNSSNIIIRRASAKH